MNSLIFIKSFDNFVYYSEFFFIFIFIFFSFLFSFIFFFISYFIGTFPKILDKEKTSIYECGFSSIQSIHSFFFFKHLSIILIFLIFEIELIWCIPWTACFIQGLKWNLFFFWSMFPFICLLLLSLLYEYKFGILNFLKKN